MLILEVRLSVVTNDPVRIRAWLLTAVTSRDMSVQVVVQPVEQTFSQRHVTNWVDVLELDRAGNLTISMGPFMLDAFHVPLVNDGDNGITLCLVDLLEEVLVTVIHEDFL